MVLLNKNIKLIINYVLGPVVFLLLAFTVYRQMQAQHGWQRSVRILHQAIVGGDQWKIWLVILLMVLNWGLEARKWQLLIRPVQELSLWQSLMGTLTGVTLASFTPNRTGEYFGRMLYLRAENRPRSVSLTMLGSFAQMVVTLATGCAGLLYLRLRSHYDLVLNWSLFNWWLDIFFLGSFVCLLILSVLYFRISILTKLLTRNWPNSKFTLWVKDLEDFNATFLARILSYSLIRYIVFIVQYQIMFSVCGVSLTLTETLAGMGVVFLVIAIIPSFTFLSELGVRWEASIQVLELFGAGTVGIFAASFGIWVVNLIIPALAGSLLILGIKLFKISN
ncbi:MAG TPA: lysylphosphatidylglycerol synthase domain-containing protein [Puia sp.]|nr:lysylphosphatidylglycerol synthase domain-containing protein [Puia sp.]